MATFVPKDYWESRLHANWGLDGVGYMRLGAAFNRWMYRVQTTIFRRHVTTLRSDWADVNVLDIGSGTGHYLTLWKDLGVRSVAAADLTDVVVERLRATFRCDCYSLDVGGDLPPALTARQFDVVSAFAVLFHVMDDDRYARAIQNVSRLVAPGGLFVFSENFLHGPTQRFPNFVARRLVDIEALLEANGFRVRKRVPMFVLMNAPFDTNGTAARTIWRVGMSPVRRFQSLGALAGALLYGPEILLTSMMSEGPSTELMVCERLRCDGATGTMPALTPTSHFFKKSDIAATVTISGS
jgi:SAM-dependent methyltransferase